jgi:hypothetical protein
VNPFFVGMDRGVRQEFQKLGYEPKKVDLIIICPIMHRSPILGDWCTLQAAAAEFSG